MPPKNMISVMRKTHMPITAVSVCCSMLAKWWRRSGLCSTTAGVLSLNGSLLEFVIVIGFPGHGWSLVEIKGSGWRADLPFQTGSAPGIVGRGFSVTHRPEEIHHGQQISHRQDRRPCGRQHIQNLEF